MLNVSRLVFFLYVPRFKESVNQKLRSKRAKSIIVGFKFNLNDIRDIEAVVTPMTIYQ